MNIEMFGIVFFFYFYFLYHSLRLQCTSLMLASAFGHFEIVKYLTENGADVNAKNNEEVNFRKTLKRF